MDTQPTEPPSICHGWKEMGEAIHMTAERARALHKQGLIPAHRMGRRVWAFRDELLKALVRIAEAEAMKPKASTDG